MKSAKLTGIFILLGILTKVSAQNFNVNCNFLVATGLYTCHLFGVTIPDNENINVIIGGQHLPPRTNVDVQRVQISISSIPFIITELFTTFPNIIDFAISGAGLLRIQTDAFNNAVNLRTVVIANNPDFGVIFEKAFVGAPNLLSMQFISNQIDKIDENAFVELAQLQNLRFDGNNIKELPANIFHPLEALRVLFITNNPLEKIDGRLLANNHQILQLDFSRNQINAIGRDFLDGLPGLQLFNAIQNVCVNDFWIIGGTTSIDSVREGLEKCFDNFVEPPEGDVRKFVLELRGTLLIRDEDGNEILKM